MSLEPKRCNWSYVAPINGRKKWPGNWGQKTVSILTGPTLSEEWFLVVSMKGEQFFSNFSQILGILQGHFRRVSAEMLSR